jgi:hypothetical protein
MKKFGDAVPSRIRRQRARGGQSRSDQGQGRSLGMRCPVGSVIGVLGEGGADLIGVKGEVRGCGVQQDLSSVRLETAAWIGSGLRKKFRDAAPHSSLGEGKSSSNLENEKIDTSNDRQDLLKKGKQKG